MVLMTTELLYTCSLPLSTVIITTGAVSISEMIKINHTLQVLNISRNPIGDEGIVAIARALYNARISELDVSYCNITVDGAIAILEAAVANGVCQEVWIDDEYKSDDKVKELMSILEERKRQEVGSIIT